MFFLNSILTSYYEGGGSCDPGDSDNVEVSIFAYLAENHEPVLLERLAYNSYKVRKSVKNLTGI